MLAARWVRSSAMALGLSVALAACRDAPTSAADSTAPAADVAALDATLGDLASAPDQARAGDAQLETGADAVPTESGSTSDVPPASDVTAARAGPPCAKNGDCPDPNLPCLEARCLVATKTCAVVPSLDNAPCDDGDSCTVADHCADGLCQPGTNGCGCTSDAACAALDDANLCNGIFFATRNRTRPCAPPSPDRKSCARPPKARALPSSATR